MPTRIVDAQHERTKRRLRLRIGRLRRRLDGRVRGVGRQAARLTSWRTYVRRYPAYAVLAAAGIGLTAGAGLSRVRGRWMRMLGMRLVRGVGQKAAEQAWREVRRIWSESAPGTPELPAGEPPATAAGQTGGGT